MLTYWQTQWPNYSGQSLSPFNPCYRVPMQATRPLVWEKNQENYWYSNGLAARSLYGHLVSMILTLLLSRFIWLLIVDCDQLLPAILPYPLSSSYSLLPFLLFTLLHHLTIVYLHPSQLPPSNSNKYLSEPGVPYMCIVSFSQTLNSSRNERQEITFFTRQLGECVPYFANSQPEHALPFNDYSILSYYFNQFILCNTVPVLVVHSIRHQKGQYHCILYMPFR